MRKEGRENGEKKANPKREQVKEEKEKEKGYGQTKQTNLQDLVRKKRRRKKEEKETGGKKKTHQKNQAPQLPSALTKIMREQKPPNEPARSLYSGTSLPPSFYRPELYPLRLLYFK